MSQEHFDWKQLQGQLIVSCQALEDEPLHGAHFMAQMALAAYQGGAKAIRANGVEDVKAIKQTVNIPVIGLIKREYPNSDVYITPTHIEVNQLIMANANVIALDATKRSRPNKEALPDLIDQIHKEGKQAMADISTLEEGLAAAEAGADAVSTTMSGYTPYSPQQKGPDLKLVSELSQVLTIPVIAEGRITRPEEMIEAFKRGAFAVVVGSAITRPQLITERYTTAAADWRKDRI
ncbi:N-acetylmannosamine-6-phosphate 2-epimerase [Bacillaceae bacterium SIJ1]|uniref:N-acetylmannosamine-6-phosphate 2-epimerase n=1 Tax=Litoribacterium kuwaitense TaxID=1398745 RepID=UPI0013EBA361|nr:N-acetylmannosamine-6-phosphate 2-epimerase [Litoribacterium kuwaitense]NGP45367.1 N-acetylmannosamine-6-phosphate 2-epimerase [Litoribacterium kuwaitense]